MENIAAPAAPATETATATKDSVKRCPKCGKVFSFGSSFKDVCPRCGHNYFEKPFFEALDELKAEIDKVKGRRMSFNDLIKTFETVEGFDFDNDFCSSGARGRRKGFVLVSEYEEYFEVAINIPDKDENPYFLIWK